MTSMSDQYPALTASIFGSAELRAAVRRSGTDVADLPALADSITSALSARPAESDAPEPITFSMECEECFGGTWTGHQALEEAVAWLKRHDAWHKRGARWDDRDQ